MPWPAAMRMPVRRCTNAELSVMGRAPSRNPNNASAAMNNDSSVRPRLVGAAVATRDEAIAAGPAGRGLLEVMGERQHGRPDDDDEQRREHAEHHRDEHLDGGLHGP